MSNDYANGTEYNHIHTFRFRSLRLSLSKWNGPSWKGVDVDVYWRSADETSGRDRYLVTGKPVTSMSPTTLGVDAESAEHAKEQYREEYSPITANDLRAREVDEEDSS